MHHLQILNRQDKEDKSSRKEKEAEGVGERAERAGRYRKRYRYTLQLKQEERGRSGKRGGVSVICIKRRRRLCIN